VAAETSAEGLIKEGEHGVEWGTLVHSLLQLAMDHPEADLNKASIALVDEYDPEARYGELAATTVKAVLNSEIWHRAKCSEQRLTEVPFQVLMEEEDEGCSSLPTILRGAIDLIFKENDGWILVDYKTDIVGSGDVKSVVEKYAPQLRLYSDAWKKCTGEDVTEAGLYLVGYDRYIVVDEKGTSL